MLLSGEPGIGKSRLTRALQQRLASETYTRLIHFCSPYHQNSALHPIIDQLQRAAGLERGRRRRAKLAKLEELLAPSTDDVAEVAPLFAALLSIPTGGRYPPLDLAPEAAEGQDAGGAGRRRSRAWRGGSRCWCCIEDVHWIDPTSLELLELARSSACAPAGAAGDHLPARVQAALDRPRRTSPRSP